MCVLISCAAVDARLASALWRNSPEVTEVKLGMSIVIEHKLLRPPVTAHIYINIWHVSNNCRCSLLWYSIVYRREMQKVPLSL